MKHTLLAALFLCGCTAQVAPPSAPQALSSHPASPAAARPAGAPLKLTASDGTGLELVRLESKAVVQGPLAFTELHLTFENPQPRVLEGRFEVTLPDGAAISRLAMLNGNDWLEGEVVEKQRARVAYEDALHVQKDPALLEQAAGNHFQARIFPILGHSRKETILSYSQELGAGQAYNLPLRGLPKVRELTATADIWQGDNQADRHEELKYSERIPAEDFVVQRLAPAQGVIKDNLAMFSVKPKLETAEVPLESLLVLVDTSASAGPHYQEQLSQLGAVLEQLRRKGTRVKLAAFDQTVVPMEDLQALQARMPMGASHWNKALNWAVRQPGYSRVLLVGDGVITAGHERLSDFVPKLKKAGIIRVDLLAGGAVRNLETLRPLADDTGGLVLDAKDGAEANVQALTHQSVSGVAVEVEGASWVWPQRLNGLRPGQEALIFAELPEPGSSARVSLSGPVLDQSEIPLTPVAWPLLSRAAAGARIASLTRECNDCSDEQQKNLLRRRVVEMSTRCRVVSDFTAMVVLENDWEYARFGINRSALADILVIGSKGLEVQQRQAVAMAVRGSEDRRWRSDVDDPSLQAQDKAESAPTAPSAEKAQMSGQQAGYSSNDAEPSPTPNFEIAQKRAVAAYVAPPVSRRKSAPMDDFLMREPGQRRPALNGEFAQIDRMISNNQDARARARAWVEKDQGNALAWVAYAEALAAAGETHEAARAYGSIIDLYPSRADMRRYAGGCLESLGESGQELAADTFTKAMISRPDHPSSHRLVAFAELHLGHYQAAFERLLKGLRRSYPGGRFAGYDAVLKGDLALVGAAWAAQEPGQRGYIQSELRQFGLSIDDQPSTRLVLTWETDATNVDLVVKGAPTTGRLLANVTTGYGPECFVIPGSPKKLDMAVQYSAKGPMGYGMGKVEVIRHDGHGQLNFVEKPYVVMNDQAYLELGTF